MVDPITARRWIYRAMFVGLAAVLLFTRLLPLSTMPTSWPGPDVLLCLAFVWVLRRPDFLPVMVIAGIFLIEDMLLMRPPGLWTLFVLFATEFLRDRSSQTRDLPFLVEWAMVSGVMLAMLLSYRLTLALFMVPQTGLGLTLMQLLASVAAYPLVVALSHRVLRLRWVIPGEVEAQGHRL